MQTYEMPEDPKRDVLDVAPLTEVTTEEEYTDAPAFTVAAAEGRSPYTKGVHDFLWDVRGTAYSSAELAGETRKVLRWLI